MREKGAEIILNSAGFGTFEGSPITLEYHFVLRIARLFT